MTQLLAELLGDEGLPEKVSQMLTEAATLRESVQGGEITDSPTEMHGRLLSIRAVLDRVEFMVTTLARLRVKVVQIVEDRQNAYDDAYATIVNKPGQHVAEFSTGREREAKYSLGTIEERLALRKAQRLDREVAGALEYVRTLHRGIDGTRRDLDTRIRLITLETALER